MKIKAILYSIGIGLTGSSLLFGLLSLIPDWRLAIFIYGIVPPLVLLSLLIRNKIVFKIRMRICDECHEKSLQAVMQDEPWQPCWDPFHRLGSYHHMMWCQLRKWTYKQFTAEPK